MGNFNPALFANKYGFEALKDRQFFENSGKQCNCGGVYKEKKICPKCGKTMCPYCTREDGAHAGNYCWKPSDFYTAYNVSDDTYITTDKRTGERSTGRTVK